MLRFVGALFLACAAAVFVLALIGQCPVREGGALSLMFSGLAFALVPWWLKEAPARDVVADVTSESSAPVECVEPAVEPEPAEEEAPSPLGSVPDIMPEVLEPAKGKKTEIKRAYDAYALACKRSGAKALAPVEFVPLMQTLCDVLNIETRRRGAHIYLIDVRVAG
ncbi:hypothetical protein [Hyphomicrobium sp. 2TAF46]|uniref:hypothetical protein n=1 Tax=Hyphomicrobium sp. 2TAF46 TaxID=3233019 RepID=UPI003F91E02B